MKEYDKMKFINFIRPVLTSGKHIVSVTQHVTKPEEQKFKAEEHFYTASRAYTLGIEDVFSVSPAENESGDLSRLLPFITLENKTFPWDWKETEDIDGAPVPWVALIVVSSEEESEEHDMAISELLETKLPGLYFPDKSSLPRIVMEKEEDICHVLDIPLTLYQSIMPDFAEMAYLTHARRIDLSDAEDEITAKDGDFSVVMGNRLIPTGEKEPLKSTVHLVSMLGMNSAIPAGTETVRLVSLHHWNVYSVKDHSQAFQQLIEGLKQSTGMIGYDRKHELLVRGYAPKKHITKSGEITYSLYRSPLIPHESQELNIGSKFTADGYLIYDPEKGILDASYAAAFQLGRLIFLSRRAGGESVMSMRKKYQSFVHRELLRTNMKQVNLKELCIKMAREMS